MRFPCTLKNALLIIRDYFGLSFASKGLGYLAALSYYCYLSLVTNYPAIKLPVMDNFSACRNYLAENHLSCPYAPHWVQHSYLSKGLWLISYNFGSSRLFSGAVAGEWSALGKEKLLLRAEIYCHLLLWRTILWGGLFGVPSPRPEPQLVTPQPNAPT